MSIVDEKKICRTTCCTKNYTSTFGTTYQGILSQRTTSSSPPHSAVNTVVQTRPNTRLIYLLSIHNWSQRTDPARGPSRRDARRSSRSNTAGSFRVPQRTLRIPPPQSVWFVDDVVWLWMLWLFCTLRWDSSLNGRVLLYSIERRHTLYAYLC